jgi:FtsZ-binding cell division protein ZapB
MERNRLADVHEKRRTAPDSRVPISYLSIDELHEKVGRIQQERQNLLKRINYVKVSKARKKIMNEDLPFSDLAENWQRPLEDAMAWFRKQSATAQDGLKKDLVVSILEATCKEGKEKWNREESEEFAQFMIEEMRNKAKAMNDKKTNWKSTAQGFQSSSIQTMALKIYWT